MILYIFILFQIKFFVFKNGISKTISLSIFRIVKLKKLFLGQYFSILKKTFRNFIIQYVIIIIIMCVFVEAMKLYEVLSSLEPHLHEHNMDKINLYRSTFGVSFILEWNVIWNNHLICDMQTVPLAFYIIL